MARKSSVQPKAAHNECCEAMDLVLDRGSHLTPRDQGMLREMAFNFKTGAESYPTVIRFKRGKKGDKYPEFRASSYAIVNYCPFCGKRQVKP